MTDPWWNGGLIHASWWRVLQVAITAGLLAMIATLLLSLAACEIRVVTDPITICFVNGDTLRLDDTTGIRCAVLDTVPNR